MSVYRLGLISIIFLGLLSYFLYHTIYGNRGIIAKKNIEQSILKAENKLEEIRASRMELDHQVKLLRPESLDKDMLEEQARKVLGVAKPEEEVLIKEEEKK